MSKSQELLREAYRKAYRDDKPLIFPMPTESAAASFRFAFYNAIRRIRRGEEQADSELKAAIDQCSITIQKTETAWQLTLTPEAHTLGLKAIAEVLGTHKVKSTEQRIREEAESALIKELEATPEPRNGASAATPYFTRGG